MLILIKKYCCQVKKDFWTPLHVAATYGHLKILEYLIKNNAVINIKDNYIDFLQIILHPFIICFLKW